MKTRVIVTVVMFSLCHALALSAAETKTTIGKTATKAKETVQPKQLTDPATGMELVLVKGGCFAMGGDGADNEKPIHEVCVADFYLGKYEVTQSQWTSLMGNNPSRFAGCGPSCPVESVSWSDVQNFLRSISEKSGKTYRLPTEAEWEYAARSGSAADLWAGTGDEARLGEYAWYGKNANETTHKAGQKKANAMGLYDMGGNVWEWCQDWYGEGYYKESPPNSPAGPEQGASRVIRGGSYENEAVNLRGANRNDAPADTKDANLGFRVLLMAN
jgi:formylglycine-generating enzyme required for sulfatase activity